MTDCAHTSTVRILAYVKCTTCAEVWARDHDDNCDDCEFSSHKCQRCGAALGHSEAHVCPVAVRR